MLPLLTLLVLCHFLGDFTPLSTQWMLEAKRLGKPLFPILVHGAVHGLLMFLALLFFVEPSKAMQLGLIQWVAHTSIDVWKGKMGAWFPVVQNMSHRAYWVLMGVDQLLHQLTIVGMLWML